LEVGTRSTRLVIKTSGSRCERIYLRLLPFRTCIDNFLGMTSTQIIKRYRHVTERLLIRALVAKVMGIHVYCQDCHSFRRPGLALATTCGWGGLGWAVA